MAMRVVREDKEVDHNMKSLMALVKKLKIPEKEKIIKKLKKEQQ